VLSGRIKNVKKIITNTKKAAAVATVLVLVIATGAHAQERSRDRGAPIIFSSPKKDTISTNLHEVNVKQTPFKNLEAEIRKPFEIFDSGPAQPKFRPPQRINNAPPMNKSNLKAIMEKSVEEQFLIGNQSGQEDPNDPFKSPESSLDPLRHKPKTALDRYYDRLEREQAGRTNSNSATDLFGRNKERSLEEKNSLEAGQSGYTSGPEHNMYSRANHQTSNNAATDNGFSRTGKKPDSVRSLDGSVSDPFDRAATQRETRMENFKKLLDGPTYNHPQNNNSFQKFSTYGSTEPSVQRPTQLTPPPTWSSAKPTAAPPQNPGSSFSKSAGIVGGAARPAGLQDYASSAGASLSTPIAPIQQPKMKPSAFNPPTRR
jgi:hypothetical protein